MCSRASLTSLLKYLPDAQINMSDVNPQITLPSPLNTHIYKFCVSTLHDF